MKKKILKITALCLALVLIAGVAFFANALAGNPVSKYLATKTAEKHIEEVYGDTDFVLERVTYNFKNGDYIAAISSPSSVDTSFTLQIGLDGTLYDDNYEWAVLSGNNTRARLVKEYSDMTDKVFSGSTFPYEVQWSYGSLEFDDGGYEIGYEPHAKPIVVGDLVVDGVYDVRELAKESGWVSLTIYSDDLSAQNMAKILLDVKELFDKAGVPFYSIDCEIREHIDENEEGNSRYKSVQAEYFLYSDIYEEGMEQRVAENIAKTEAKYAELDKELKEGI